MGKRFHKEVFTAGSPRKQNDEKTKVNHESGGFIEFSIHNTNPEEK